MTLKKTHFCETQIQRLPFLLPRRASGDEYRAKNHQISLIHDLNLANLCGFFVNLNKNLVTSKSNLKNVEFGSPKNDIIKETENILSMQVYE